jgi:anhydro-N-acetylmuramic acid kinase
MMILEAMLSKPRRFVAGIMSGTSVDGVDAVIAQLDGTGVQMRMEVLGRAHEPYETVVRESILENSAASGTSTEAISQLNAALPFFFAAAVEGALLDANVTLDELDLVGCHGQTIHHVPVAGSVGNVKVRSTLQIGDPSVLANLLRTPVVGDFRTADMALGGQGAPLVPYFDFVRFRDDHESRVLLNLGGIANLTLLRAGCDAPDVIAFDTGPANMVIDQLCQRLIGRNFDDGGSVAATSTANKDVLSALLEDDYYRLKPPKSTGRERFGSRFVDDICDRFSSSFGADSDWTDHEKATVIATATALTADSVAASLAHLGSGDSIDRVIVSGGGTKNRTLMSLLAASLQPAIVESIDDHGIESSDKEALCFAVLAHELVNGTPTGMPSVTGASRPAMQGKICLPS